MPADISGVERLALVHSCQCSLGRAFTNKVLVNYHIAVRANRQLAIVLQTQGLNEDAARFAYRAQVLQKTVFRLQMIQTGVNFRKRLQMLGAWLFSWFLFLLAGYGYKPLRSFLAYLFVIISFAISYYLLGVHDIVGPHHMFGPYHLSWYEAIVVSMTAFHLSKVQQKNKCCDVEDISPTSHTKKRSKGMFALPDNSVMSPFRKFAGNIKVRKSRLILGFTIYNLAVISCQMY